MSDADRDAMISHFVATGAKVEQGCPLCAHKGWKAEGPVALMRLDGVPPDVTVGTKAVPVLLLICTKCGYTMQFAWTFIKGLSGNNAD